MKHHQRALVNYTVAHQLLVDGSMSCLDWIELASSVCELLLSLQKKPEGVGGVDMA